MTENQKRFKAMWHRLCVKHVEAVEKTYDTANGSEDYSRFYMEASKICQQKARLLKVEGSKVEDQEWLKDHLKSRTV